MPSSSLQAHPYISRVGTSTIGIPSPRESPFAVAIPIRRPVNEPGPPAIASNSILFIVIAAF